MSAQYTLRKKFRLAGGGHLVVQRDEDGLPLIELISTDEVGNSTTVSIPMDKAIELTDEVLRLCAAGVDK